MDALVDATLVAAHSRLPPPGLLRDTVMKIGESPHLIPPPSGHRSSCAAAAFTWAFASQISARYIVSSWPMPPALAVEELLELALDAGERLLMAGPILHGFTVSGRHRLVMVPLIASHWALVS